MKPYKCLSLLFFLLVYANVFAQKDSSKHMDKQYPVRILTIEPGVGIHANFGTDLLIANLVQWNPRKKLSLASYTSFNINNISQRNFNHVKTNYNYSINQKFGVGTTFYMRKSANTFLLMIGAKYTTYKETLDNPNLNKVSTSISALSPDYGVMHSFKRGWKKYFFTSRFYLPLSPLLTKGAKIEYVQGTFRDIALEFGVGIKIK